MNSRMQATVERSTCAEEREILARECRRRGEHIGEIERAEQRKTVEDAERETEIADPVDDEGLDRRGVGGGPVVPEADQQIGRKADAFPAEEHLDEIVGRHQHQHEEGEEAEDRP